MEATPFVVAVPDPVLLDLRTRLEKTRIAEDFGNEDWRYGVNGDYLRELVEYWRDAFDWREQERRINRYAHFKVNIDDVPVHFVHVRGTGCNPLPIILSHGWPWTFWDFERVIQPLVDPESFGGDPDDAFDVVVPSLPGFIFSSPLRRTGVNDVVTADIWVRLMCDVLGYERFGAHGGDWGQRVSVHLGQRYPERVIGIHLSSAPIAGFGTDRPWADAFAGLYARSQAPRNALVAWERRRAAHVAVQGLDPQTFAYGMQDSPLGLCAWILGRRRAWSDCGGDIETVFSKDDLLTVMTLYWATDSFATSVRYYWEAMNAGGAARTDRPWVASPTGVSLFRRDLPPGYEQAWLAEQFNLQHVGYHQRGGHFAAFENPDAIVEDLRATFRPLRA